ncbi:Rrf2 family transcriptional regulator [Exiguobacterium indicum]|uniref:Rrf2 family transcriptional regulator n=1 Tax=Exiguobacterium indicum TaxID=296995 RepID=UPI003C6CB295
MYGNKTGSFRGIRLRRRPHEINIGRLFREIEPLHLIEQIDSPLFPFSNINERWKSMFDQALDAFLRELDKYTLADLIDNPDELFTHLSLK